MHAEQTRRPIVTACWHSEFSHIDSKVYNYVIKLIRQMPSATKKWPISSLSSSFILISPIRIGLVYQGDVCNNVSSLATWRTSDWRGSGVEKRRCCSLGRITFPATFWKYNKAIIIKCMRSIYFFVLWLRKCLISGRGALIHSYRTKYSQ